MCSRLKQVPWWLYLRRPSYSHFFHWSTQRGCTIILILNLCRVTRTENSNGTVRNFVWSYRWKNSYPNNRQNSTMFTNCECTWSFIRFSVVVWHLCGLVLSRQFCTLGTKDCMNSQCVPSCVGCIVVTVTGKWCPSVLLIVMQLLLQNSVSKFSFLSTFTF